MKNKIFRIGLSRRLTSLFVFFSIMTSISIVIILLLFYKKNLDTELKERSLSSVSLGSNTIKKSAIEDLNNYIDAFQTEKRDTPLKEIIKSLIQIKNSSQEISAVYILTKPPSQKIKLILKIDGDTIKYSDANDFFLHENSSQLAKTFTTNTPMVEIDTFSNSKKGKWISAYAPVANSDYILGIDLSYNKTYGMLTAYIFLVLKILLIIIVVSFIIAFMIGNNITAPIKAFINGTEKIVDGDLSYRLYSDKKSTKTLLGNNTYEIRKLISSFNKLTNIIDDEMESVSESSCKFQTIFENATEGIFQYNTMGSFISVNPSMAKILGYSSPVELLRVLKRFDDHLWAFSKQKKAFFSAMRTAGKVININVQFYRQDRAMIWCTLSAFAVIDRTGKTTMYEGIITDMTDKKIAEDSIEGLFTYQLDLTNAYSRFFPSQFLKIMGKENIQDLQLGDHVKRKMSVLFSDIRSFTTLSESMSPSDNFKFLNSFMSRMAPIIKKHNGIVDKYIGDAIMALFPGDPEDAILAAIEMYKELTEFNKERVKKEREKIDIGIGIHMGDLILGTIGEEARMDTTVISDTVNIAARLEGLTKTFGAKIIISEQLLKNISDFDNFYYRALGRIKVKGKEKAVNIIEVVLPERENSYQIINEDAKELFEKALELYYDQQFDDAAKSFEKIFTIDEDSAAIYYHAKCLQYVKHGYIEDWDGIEKMDTK